MQYRHFHNADPPLLHKLWHACALGRSAAEGFSCDAFEMFSMAVPFFDRQGLIVAVDVVRQNDKDVERVVGFVHAGFAVNATEDGLDTRQGVIAGLMVHPDYRRRHIGTELVRQAETYLQQSGATSVEAGSGLDRGGFYVGIYGGLQPSGFSAGAAAWREFFSSCGYQFGAETYVLRRDLEKTRDPVNVRLMRHRRHLNLVITDRPRDEPWWWFVRFGQVDSLRFELQERASREVMASGQIIGLDLFIPKWGVRSVGVRDVYVPEVQRRHGYALALVLEICKRLREERVELVEAQVAATDKPAIELFTSAKFSLDDRLHTYRKSLAGAG